MRTIDKKNTKENFTVLVNNKKIQFKHINDF